MPRSKKSRKIGSIGVAKSPDYKPVAKIQKKKPGKGRPSGSRHNVESKQQSGSSGRSLSSDPRHGSKKSIPLIKEAVKTTRYATPKQELSALENDARLINLLDKQDSGQTLSFEQNQYVQSKLDRHAVLCSLLGIHNDQEEESNTDDPLASLEAISMKEFLDSSDKL
jgi:ribosome assembly protein YihI (activator of Der GTPase)